MKKHKESIYEYQVNMDPNGEGYTVTIPKLPGLVTEGANLKEAREMAKDAIRCYLGSLLKEKGVVFSVGEKRKERILVGV